MQLHEAYERLEWDTPLAFERAALGTTAARRRPRHVGTSAHTLIELYLDMERASRVLVREDDFVVVCNDVAQGRYLRQWLETIHARLGLLVDTKRVRFLPLNQGFERLRGSWFRSWAVFCDHAVKRDDERNLGPFRLVRTLEKDGDHWLAFDRDGHRVCKLTESGKRELADATTCPLTIRGVGTPTTYPAFQGIDELNAVVRLREAFRR